MKTIELLKSPRSLRLKGQFHSPNPAARPFLDNGVLEATTRYDKASLERTIKEAVAIPIEKDFSHRDKEFLWRFQLRVAELNLRKMAHPGWIPPASNRSPGIASIHEISDQLGDDWDACMVRMRPFVHKDLDCEQALNAALSNRSKNLAKAAKKVLRSYWFLEKARSHHDMVLYRRDDVTLLADEFDVVMSNGERGDLAILIAYGLPDNPLRDDQLEDDFARLKRYLESPKTSNSQVFETAHICRVVNDEFVTRWLKQFEYHDLPHDLGIPFAQGHTTSRICLPVSCHAKGREHALGRRDQVRN